MDNVLFWWKLWSDKGLSINHKKWDGCEQCNTLSNRWNLDLLPVCNLDCRAKKVLEYHIWPRPCVNNETYVKNREIWEVWWNVNFKLCTWSMHQGVHVFYKTTSGVKMQLWYYAVGVLTYPQTYSTKRSTKMHCLNCASIASINNTRKLLNIRQL